MLHCYTCPCHLTIDPCYTVTPPLPIYHRSMLHHYTPWVCHRYLCIMLYVKLTWCSGLPWISGQLEDGWGQSVMKLIQCSALTWIYGQWKLFGVMVFQRSMLDWLGGPSAKVGSSAKFALMYVSCFSVVVLHGSMVNWRRGQSAIDPGYTITPPLPLDHRSMLHCYTFPCQLTIDPCYTITPHKSALGICAWCYMWNLCGVVVFHGSMVNWRRVGSVCHELYLV